MPLCPKCSKLLKKFHVRFVTVKYYEFDYETEQYKLAQREKIEDDNLFHCSECGAGIEMKEIFETLIHIP
jgi:predicted nucleic acid-binding Zn ribbon protein